MELEIINILDIAEAPSVDVITEVKELSFNPRSNKCEFIHPSGRKCPKERSDGNFCSTHNKPKTKIEMTDEAILSTMYTYQYVAYTILERMRSDVPKITEKLDKDKDKMEQIYKSIIATYGRDKMISYMSPIALWLAVSGQHLSESYIDNKKKDSQPTQPLPPS